jgi:hypothetical protein
VATYPRREINAFRAGAVAVGRAALAWRRAWKAVGALFLEEQAPPDCATERNPRVRS